jgi:superfamily I DNA/RNA helicase
VIEVAASPEDESALVASHVQGWLDAGVGPGEVAIFVRSREELPRAEAVVSALGVPSVVLEDGEETVHGRLTVSTMHRAKGLEFRAVAVMACDENVIPSEARIDAVTDDADLDEVYQTERHLLYVACTRARDHLLVTGVEPASEFLEDLAAPEVA